MSVRLGLTTPTLKLIPRRRRKSQSRYTCDGADSDLSTRLYAAGAKVHGFLVLEGKFGMDVRTHAGLPKIDSGRGDVIVSTSVATIVDHR